MAGGNEGRRDSSSKTRRNDKLLSRRNDNWGRRIHRTGMSDLQGGGVWCMIGR